jgi:nucleoside-diphosphate-sugar epimerase
MKYLVTGGAGFIGCNIARKLLEEGHQVRIIDNFSSGKQANIAEILHDIELIEGDIRDFWTVVKAVKGIDYILHQAALPSVPRSIKNPLTSNAVNIDGTLNVLEAAKEAGVTNEHYCRVYWQLYGFPTVCLRYFNIFGPRQDPHGEYSAVIPKFIDRLVKGQRPVVYGDGEQSRDFTFIDDCVQANLLAASDDRICGDFFNVACGGQYTLNELLNKLRNIIGVDSEAEYTDPRPGDIKHSFAAIDKLGQYGYKPKVSFDEGLKRTVEFFAG